MTDQSEIDRIVQILKAHIQRAVVTPKCGDPIDTDVDEEGLYPWIVHIVLNAARQENGRI